MPATPVASATAHARRRRTLHRWFDAGVMFKGAEGVLEIVTGAWLSFDRSILQNVVFRITAKELVHDPEDMVARTLRHWAEELGSGRQTFASLYLVAHGVVKIVLAVSLLREYRWAYPTAVAAQLLLAAYELYRFSHTHAPVLPVVATLDIVIAWLVWREGRARAAAPAGVPRHG